MAKIYYQKNVTLIISRIYYHNWQKYKFYIFQQHPMINQFAKRPESKHKIRVRPNTGKVSQASMKQSEECFEMGKKHMNKKQYDQALKHYMNATIHNPHNFKAQCNMGAIYKELGRFSEAKACYRKALHAFPNDHISLYNLGNLERITGNDEAAISLYSRVINLKEQDKKDIGNLYQNSLINQGICYKNLELFDQAISCYDKALQLNPNEYPIHFNKAMCLLKKIYSLIKLPFKSVQKKYCGQAESMFQKILSTNPNNFTAKLALIQLKYLQNTTEETLTKSIKQLQSLQKTAPEQQRFEVEIKIKYCQNQLRKFQDKNKPVISKNQKKQAPRQNKEEEKKPTNKYDKPIQQNKQKIKHVSEKPTQKEIKPAEPKKQIKVQKDSKTNQQRVPQNKIAQKQPLQGKPDKQQLQAINKLIQSKNYDEAFELARNLPQCQQKFEIQIIINFLQSQQTENETILESALAIYEQHIMKNNENTPITKQTCSQRGHEIMANMLNISGSYAQASKHYEVLLQLLQDQKLKDSNEQKIQQIHAGLGVCYAERGLLQQAIQQYRKSYSIQPDNYFLMTTLCGLLIQNQQKDEARKYYEDFLKKNGGQNMEDKVAYIDSLLNISICMSDSPQYQNSVTKAIQAVQKYFPTHDDIKKNLDSQAILSLYLRYVDILENKLDQKNKSKAQQKQTYDKMLDTYLTCLEFESCPDREAVSMNAGIIFYLCGCYANALAFYKTVVTNKKAVANNIGLSLLHLQDYEKALGYFIYAVQQNPQSIVYSANLQIAKWICAINEKQIFPKYSCKCQSMFQIRVTLGLWMLDQLTVMIDKNQIKLQNQSNSNTTVQQQVQQLLNKLSERCQKFTSTNQAQVNKINHICGVFNKHIRQSHKEKQSKSNFLIPIQIRDLCLKKCADVKQMQENMSKIASFLKSLNQSASQFTIIQITIALFLISNSHLTNTVQNIKQTLVKKGIHNISKVAQNLKSAEASQQSALSVVKSAQINYPTVQLKLKLLQNVIRDAQCMIQNTTQYLIEHIQNVYYQKTDNIIWPLVRQFTHPHCDNSEGCQRCIINSIHLYSSLFDKKMSLNQVKLNQNWTVNQEIESIPKSIENFVQKCLESQQKGVFSKTTKTLTVKLTEKNLPFRLKTYHKKFENLVQFVKNIDSTFKIVQEKESLQKGVRIVQINSNLILQMYWGESLTVFDRFWHQFVKRQTNINQDALLLIGDSALTAHESFQSPDQTQTKIKTLLGFK